MERYQLIMHVLCDGDTEEYVTIFGREFTSYAEAISVKIGFETALTVAGFMLADVEVTVKEE